MTEEGSCQKIQLYLVYGDEMSTEVVLDIMNANIYIYIYIYIIKSCNLKPKSFSDVIG